MSDEQLNNDIIETDDDVEEDYNNGGLYPYDPTEEDIDIREDPQTVYELIRKYNNGKLIINPDFQRNLVWEHQQKSKFIESVILNFPLPPFYVNQTREGKYIVVDGLQRTSTLHEFMNDKFKLKGLKALTKLNGYNFSELATLNGDYQTRIEDKKLNLYVIRPSVPVEVVYDIFNRINTGGTMLNRQEVRNCIFIGKASELLKELSEEEYFKKAIDNGVPSKRMKDRELVLRYLAFIIYNYETDYDKDNINIFLDKAMQKINLMEDTEIENIKADFKGVMTLTFEFFGKNNFRLPNQTRSRINAAIFESVCYFFSVNSNSFLNKNKQCIQRNFNKLLKDDNYLKAVRSSTNNKTRVITRFKLAQEILGEGCETC